MVCTHLIKKISNPGGQDWLSCWSTYCCIRYRSGTPHSTVHWRADAVIPQTCYWWVWHVHWSSLSLLDEIAHLPSDQYSLMSTAISEVKDVKEPTIVIKNFQSYITSVPSYYNAVIAEGVASPHITPTQIASTGAICLPSWYSFTSHLTRCHHTTIHMFVSRPTLHHRCHSTSRLPFRHNSTLFCYSDVE